MARADRSLRNICPSRIFYKVRRKPCTCVHTIQIVVNPNVANFTAIRLFTSRYSPTVRHLFSPQCNRRTKGSPNPSLTYPTPGPPDLPIAPLLHELCSHHCQPQRPCISAILSHFRTYTPVSRLQLLRSSLSRARYFQTAMCEPPSPEEELLGVF